MNNTFAVLYGINDLRLETQPVPELGPNDVLICLRAMGLCGTDLSVMYKGMRGDVKVKYPTGVGHEASGTVVNVGSKVKNFKSGDRVCIEVSSPCRSCEFCYKDSYNVCEKSSFHHRDVQYPGCVGQYYISRDDLVFKLADNISYEEGAMVEPLAVALHACRRAQVKLASTVLIIGAGPIGLACLLSAKAMGATNILVTDVRPNRLKIAKELGAHHTLLVGVGKPVDEAKKVSTLMGCMPQITLECSGTESGITFALYGTRSRGVVIAVGILGPNTTLPLVNAMVREIDIRGTYRYVDCYPDAIEMISKGLVNVKQLITHSFKINEIQKAFDMFKAGDDGAIKCIIKQE